MKLLTDIVSAPGIFTNESTQTLLNKTFDEVTILGAIKETIYVLSGVDLDPANGTIQTKTVTASTTFTESLESGESLVLLLVKDSANIITFPTITWISVSGAAPSLEAKSVLVFWKIGTTLYGYRSGSFV
mgnify:CR=1 FL=1